MSIDLEELQFQIKHHVDEWAQFLKPKPKSITGEVQAWQPPPNGFIKINSDGAFVESEKAGGWGVIARDCNGHVIFAAAGKISHVKDALHAEAIAVENDIRLADQMGMGHVIVATDSIRKKA